MVVHPGELGAYLRARRERVAPAEVGLPAGGRRRTAGLRREEVATLAGVSVDYYMRLEQGRDQHPSSSVVAALARALRLSGDETTHLHLLAGLPAPGRTPRPHVRAQVDALLTALDPVPAYVLSRAMDILAWNRAMATVLIDFAEVPEHERNIVRLSFLHPPVRALWADWDTIADESVANIRAATARHPGDPDLVNLVGELSIASPEFARRWGRHDVREKTSGRKHLAHPAVGPLDVDFEVLSLNRDDQSLITFLPADATTAAALDRLLAPDPTEAAAEPGLRIVR